MFKIKIPVQKKKKKRLFPILDKFNLKSLEIFCIF